MGCSFRRWRAGRMAGGAALWFAGKVLARLGVLAPDGVDEVAGRDDAAVGGGEVSGRDGRAADHAAGNRVQRREPLDVDAGIERRGWRQQPAPQLRPLARVWRIEPDDEVEAPRERAVEVLAQVGGEYDEAFEALDPGEQVGRLEVGVAVPGVADLGAPAEQGVGLVEEQGRPGALGGFEGRGQVLLGLSHPLGDHPGQVDDQEVTAEGAGEHLAGQRLPGPRRAVEEQPQPLPAGAAGQETPPFQHRLPVLQARGRLEELGHDVRGDHEVVEGGHRVDHDRAASAAPGRDGRVPT